jgi:hypothetical protein
MKVEPEKDLRRKMETVDGNGTLQEGVNNNRGGTINIMAPPPT